MEGERKEDTKCGGFVGSLFYSEWCEKRLGDLVNGVKQSEYFEPFIQVQNYYPGRQAKIGFQTLVSNQPW